ADRRGRDGRLLAPGPAAEPRARRPARRARGPRRAQRRALGRRDPRAPGGLGAWPRPRHRGPVPGDPGDVGATLIGLGIAPFVLGFAGVVVILTVVNGIGALADLFAQSLLQLSVPRQLRGRAGGAWVVAIGLAPLGQLQIGALASLFGVSVAFGASGLALAVLAGTTALLVPRARRL